MNKELEEMGTRAMLKLSEAPRNPWTLVLARHCAIVLGALRSESTRAMLLGEASDSTASIVFEAYDNLRRTNMENMENSWKEIRVRWEGFCLIEEWK